MRLLKELSTAQGRLTYGLTESKLGNVPTFGITVSTTLFGGEETALVEHITADYDFAEKFFYLLADNTVLPSTLKEIAEEYISAKTAVFV
ncbi:MAG: DUF6514 family protein [Oscillospiraceae bacterium]|nr:DUF6514 family protein [Oscillospiraceae bacterium]